MFIHQTCLDQLLTPKQYYDPEWHKTERTDVFEKSWNFACILDEIPEDGSYLVRDLCGTSIILWNIAGNIRTFLNHCLHRHSQIKKDGKGKDTSLKCLYHGWEYSSEGQIQKIPDVSHFKGIKLPCQKLKEFKVEKIGILIFVNFSQETKSLREVLGPFVQELERHYSGIKLLKSFSLEVDVNWKLPVENAVESYHVPIVHPNTFSDYRPSSLHDHQLNENFTSYKDLKKWGTSISDRIIKFLTWFCIANPTFERFTHAHVFPSSLFYFGDLYTSFVQVEPLDAEKSKFRVYNFYNNKLKYRFISFIIYRFFLLFISRFLDRTLEEDLKVLPFIQKGMKNSIQKGGPLSSREERIFAFQEYLYKKTQHSGHD
jgi:choline monooxygenase